jgi:hypothetical protein
MGPHARAEREWRLGLAAQSAARLKRAFGLFLRAASHGHTEAKFSVGLYREAGVGTRKSCCGAVRCFRDAAVKGHPGALYCLARCYEYGTGVGVDHAAAQALLTQAASKGDPDAMYWLSLNCERDKRAVGGSNKALYWLRKAARAGSAEAQFHLAYILSKGAGLRRSPAQAYRWYLRAARNWKTEAQYNVGWCYQEGHGVATNKRAAAKWYQRAALAGDLEAAVTLAGLYLDSRKSRLRRKGIQLLRAAARRRNARACYNLGLCYLNGIGVALNRRASLHHLRMAAALGHREARRRLCEARCIASEKPGTGSARRCRGSSRMATRSTASGTSTMRGIIA